MAQPDKPNQISQLSGDPNLKGNNTNAKVFSNPEISDYSNLARGSSKAAAAKSLGDQC